MIADRAISEKPDDTVNFSGIEELSRAILAGEMLFHFVPYGVIECKEIMSALNCAFIQGLIDYHIHNGQEGLLLNKSGTLIWIYHKNVIMKIFVLYYIILFQSMQHYDVTCNVLAFGQQILNAVTEINRWSLVSFDLTNSQLAFCSLEWSW